MRKFVPVFLLLSVVCSARAQDPAVKPRPYAMPPCHCLRQLLQDYPGPYDLYYCITHVNDCTEGEEEMWYGMPTNAYRPQHCEQNQCEPYAAYKLRDSGFPRHGMALTTSGPGTKAHAWELIESGLKAAAMKTTKLEWSAPDYHEIPREKVPEGLEMDSSVIMMAVPIKVDDPKDPAQRKTIYLCVQLDSADGEKLTPINVVDTKPGAGHQFSIKYTVQGQERKGLVWLK